MTSFNGLDNVPFVQKINLEALEHTNELERKWNQYKREYEELKISLQEFPKELSAPIMMPLGPKVFVRAKLCNTNEVFIRHGENIFTKQTAFEAKAVCERQIKRCDEMIAAIAKEKKLLCGNLNAREEIVAESNDDLKEIIEPLNEEEEAAWREEHKRNVKEYKQNLAKLQHNEDNNLKNYDDILTRLEEVDLLENKLNDMVRNEIDVDNIDSSSNESCDDEDSDSDEDYDDDEYDIDDCEDEEDDDIKELEIVFTNDAPETSSLKKKSKKKVSFNNDVQIKEFESRPEEHFIRRRDEIKETEKPKIYVTEIDDIVERVSGVRSENETTSESVDEEENTRPMSRFKANRMNNKNVN